MTTAAEWLIQAANANTPPASAEEIAAAVLAAAQATPIQSDVRKVNTVPVTGNGQPATPWGPAS